MAGASDIQRGVAAWTLLYIASACSTAPAATGKLVTVDQREAGSVADGHRNVEVAAPAQCLPIPEADDVGCPDAEFPYGLCAAEGQRCLSSTPFEGIRAAFRCGVTRHDTPPPGWIHDAFFYDPGGIPPLPNELTLDDSLCALRPVIPCDCETNETAENAVERNAVISRCQMTNPTVFVTFDDAGCPTRARYDGSRVGIAFEACLAEALVTVRFDCATSATRVVLMTQREG